MRLPYYSFNFRYALTVRLMVLLFLISTVATACSGESSSEKESSMPDYNDGASDTTAIKPVTRTTPATIDFLGNPFVANRSQSSSLSAYFDKIQDDFTLDADAIENTHRPSITDTIYTIRFGNSMMELYAPTQTGELLLQVADIRDKSITMRDNIRVGISHAELVTKLRTQNLQVQQTQHEVTASEREGAPSLLHFYMKNGKVSRILYEGYVD